MATVQRAELLHQMRQKGRRRLMNIENCPAYELIKEEEIRDIHAKGYLLRHRKSGARVLLMENDDENKVFNIAFRTPPANSTGVAHILEHSVLEGSREFPLKDPFVELVKGSLNTFLNAMTYPDKTMYPVASCNDTDFRNLMHVYLDAVFYPNIYERKEIFLQEGWNYQLESEDAPISYNGVVYNEMKGAFSSADEVLEREIFNSLFPDTPYGVESGGDPSCIPDLTYEEFLDFHRKYYHPSNSYIYLYGNMNMEEYLAWMDEKYLCAFEEIPVESQIPMQKPFDAPRELRIPYPVLENETEEDNTYLSCNMVVGTALDVRLCLAFSVLEYVLLDAPGAPVKQALLDARIGKDVYGSYEDGILQPFFSIVAKNAKEENREKFLEIIRSTLQNIVKDGIDQKAVEAGINYFEFRFREADYGSFPKGLIYGIDLFDSWLYSEEQPWSYLKQLDIYDELKTLAGQGYFERLIQEYLLDNPQISFKAIDIDRESIAYLHAEYPEHRAQILYGDFLKTDLAGEYDARRADGQRRSALRREGLYSPRRAPAHSCREDAERAFERIFGNRHELSSLDAAAAAGLHAAHRMRDVRQQLPYKLAPVFDGEERLFRKRPYLEGLGPLRQSRAEARKPLRALRGLGLLRRDEVEHAYAVLLLFVDVEVVRQLDAAH